MILKTSCDNCIFKNDKSCLLWKQIFIDNEYLYTDGFCRHKRNKFWSDKQDSKKIIDLISKINYEEKVVSLLIIGLDNNLNDVKLTIDSIPENDLIKEILVVCYKHPSLNDLAIILENKKIPWKFTNIMGEEKPDIFAAIDHASASVKYNWFIPIISGDIIKAESINKIDIALTLNTNIVGGFFDIDNQIKLLINKQAFIEMEGHYHQPWLEKVKEFENWKTSCMKI